MGSCMYQRSGGGGGMLRDVAYDEADAKGRHKTKACDVYIACVI